MIIVIEMTIQTIRNISNTKHELKITLIEILLKTL